MTHLNTALWNKFSAYLFYDKKLSTSKGSAQSISSRFTILQKYFQDKEFNRENFNAFVMEMKQKGYKNSYINGFIKVAKHLDKFLKLNEMTDYTYFEEGREFYDVLTPEEISKIAEAVMPYQRNAEYQNLRYKSLFYFMGTTGCRIMEALNLKWTDLVESPIGPIVTFRNTKNGEDRTVPIAPFVRDLMKSLPRNEYVFNLRHQSSANKDLQERAKKVGIQKKVWCHLLRHSFVTHMTIDREMDSMLVSRIVGHKDPATTMRYQQMNLKAMQHVMESHELFKKNQTIGMVGKSLKGFLEKLIDPATFHLTYSEEGDSINLTIKKSCV